MKEIWKDVKGYEGLYLVSNLGRVKGIERVTKYKEDAKKGKQHFVKEKIKNISEKQNGYQVVNLYKNNKGKSEYLHRVVANAFLPNPENLPTVNHKDFNKKNNCVDNLEWCSYADNNKHARQNLIFQFSRVRDIEAKNIKTNKIEIITNLNKWCKENKHDRASVYKVLAGQNAYHHNMIFRYI